jgi:hypothetical protein
MNLSVNLPKYTIYVVLFCDPLWCFFLPVSATVYPNRFVSFGLIEFFTRQVDRQVYFQSKNGQAVSSTCDFRQDMKLSGACFYLDRFVSLG